MRLRVGFAWAVCVAAGAFSWAEGPSVTVGTFPQDVATVYTAKDGLPSENVSAVAVAQNGHVFAGTDRGLAEFDGNA